MVLYVGFCFAQILLLIVLLYMNPATTLCVPPPSSAAIAAVACRARHCRCLLAVSRREPQISRLTRHCCQKWHYIKSKCKTLFMKACIQDNAGMLWLLITCIRAALQFVAICPTDMRDIHLIWAARDKNINQCLWMEMLVCWSVSQPLWSEIHCHLLSLFHTGQNIWLVGKVRWLWSGQIRKW